MSKTPIIKMPKGKDNVIHDAIAAWSEADNARAQALALEKEARQTLIDLTFPEREEGSGHKMDVGHGCVLQVTQPVSRKLDVAVFAAINTKDNKEVIEKVIDYEPKLAVAKFKLLGGDESDVFAECVTESRGTPTVKIVRPKS